MYLAMESFRYAATKDTLAAQRAKKAFDFLHYLREVTEIDGFFARSIFETNPAFDTYFDIFLLLYIYPPLLTYEDNPELKSEYQAHLNRWFNKYREIKSPFVNFTYNLLAGGDDELDNSILFLKDAPLDLVDWRIDNGKREDLNVVRKPILETLQVDELTQLANFALTNQ